MAIHAIQPKVSCPWAEQKTVQRVLLGGLNLARGDVGTVSDAFELKSTDKRRLVVHTKNLQPQMHGQQAEELRLQHIKPPCN